MSGVKYIGPVFDGSGYAEAARNYVLSIYKKGYPITLSPITFENTRPELGEDGNILRSLINNKVKYDKVIVHSTPDLWPQFLAQDGDKYKIGYTVWETSKIHPIWTDACNRVDEVWLPCDWNMNVFKDSGVSTPLFKVPHAIDVPDLDKITDFNLQGIPQGLFVFYSIFQWQERKNPYGLLTAYSAEFSGVDDVVLLLKTYRHDHASDKEFIKELILEHRKYMNLDHYPKLFLLVQNMSAEDMLALHKRGDCFVLLQRSEGWGLPHFEAAACGNPIITPSYGGQTEFLKEDNSYLVDYSLCPVGGMTWSHYYKGDQLWAEPDLEHAMKQMRRVYDDRYEATIKGEYAKKYVLENFTWDKVGNIILKRLSEIDKGI